MGNVLVTVSDKKFGYGVDNAGVLTMNPTDENSYFQPEILSAQDYYAYGATKPGRRGSLKKNAEGNIAFVFDEAAAVNDWRPIFNYRFGYNTQEATPEVTGGQHNTAEFWEYNPSGIIRWNLDPVTTPNMSPYAINNNNPIINSDPNGNCPTCPAVVIAFGVGFGADYAAQVISNIAQGQSLYDATIRNIDWGDALLSGGATALTVALPGVGGILARPAVRVGAELSIAAVTEVAKTGFDAKINGDPDDPFFNFKSPDLVLASANFGIGQFIERGVFGVGARIIRNGLTREISQVSGLQTLYKRGFGLKGIDGVEFFDVTSGLKEMGLSKQLSNINSGISFMSPLGGNLGQNFYGAKVNLDFRESVGAKEKDSNSEVLFRTVDSFIEKPYYPARKPLRTLIKEQQIDYGDETAKYQPKPKPNFSKH